jgi:hypothetical protein
MLCLEQANFILQCNIAASIRNCLDHLMLASCREEFGRKVIRTHLAVATAITGTKTIGTKYTLCSIVFSES